MHNGINHEIVSLVVTLYIHINLLCIWYVWLLDVRPRGLEFFRCLLPFSFIPMEKTSNYDGVCSPPPNSYIRRLKNIRGMQRRCTRIGPICRRRFVPVHTFFLLLLLILLGLLEAIIKVRLLLQSTTSSIFHAIVRSSAATSRSYHHLALSVFPAGVVFYTHHPLCPFQFRPYT